MLPISWCIYVFSSVETLSPIDQEPAALARRLFPATVNSEEEEDEDEEADISDERPWQGISVQ